MSVRNRLGSMAGAPTKVAWTSSAGTNRCRRRGTSTCATERVPSIAVLGPLEPAARQLGHPPRGPGGCTLVHLSRGFNEEDRHG